MKTVENKVSEAINQFESTIIIDGREYEVPAPTYGTLYEIASILSNAPKASNEIEDKNIPIILSRAQNELYAPKVLATLILGSKRLHDIHYSNKCFKWLKWAKKRQYKEVDYLTDIFTHESRISEVIIAVADIINNRMDLAFFLQGTIFLKGLNSTKQTKEIEATVHGQ